MSLLDEFTYEPQIAYFSMEIALENDIPTYSGGLGILAGDTLRSSCDLGIPVVGVSLVSHAGYFKQKLAEDGSQTESADFWEPDKKTSPLGAKITVTIEGRQVWVGGWLYLLKSYIGDSRPVILLDTDLPENSPEDRTITHYLYGDGSDYRLKQEIVLGIGGVRMLQALGFHIQHYHMNEGHSAFLALELLHLHTTPIEDRRPGESPYHFGVVREMCNFTTHTPVESGHDKFSYEQVSRIMGEWVDQATLKQLAGEDVLNMTRLALNLSETVNGVAKRHAELSRQMFPGYKVHSITNGVHPSTWTSAAFTALYDKYLPGWCHEPELLMRADCCIPSEEISQAHRQAKTELINTIADLCDVHLDVDIPVLGFARRMTAYKRPDLLFSNLERLETIAEKFPFQIVLAGKAHPKDASGKLLIKALYSIMKRLKGRITIVYLPNYDMHMALTLVAGIDLWLNTPLRPLEASGTSGMKAAFNGNPSLSILDGWWIEGCIEGITGWAIGSAMETSGEDDALHLYQKLEEVILPLYYQNKSEWLKVMQSVISKNASYFNSHRMMRRYVTETYIK